MRLGKDSADMEFETDIKIQKKIAEMEIRTSLPLEPFCQKVWDTFLPLCKNIGQMGGTQLWLDFSDTLRVSYVICDIKEMPNRGGEGCVYNIEFRTARKIGYIADGLMALLGLAALWGLTKVLNPAPEPLHYAALAGGAALAGIVYAVCRRPAGETKITALKAALQTLKDK